MSTKLKPSEKLTIEQFKQALPKTIRTRVNQQMVDSLNGLIGDQQLRENFRDNLLSYTNVMQDGRYKLGDYINAVRYCSYKLLGSTNFDAYCKTFPNRFQRLVNEGADEKTISSYSTAYNKTQLVNKILEQTLIPVHILNSDIYQKAINAQAILMMTATSEKVRSDAANSLMTHLKAPEVVKHELSIGQGSEKTIDTLQQTMKQLADMQRAAMVNGTMNVTQVAHSKLVSGEIVSEQ